MSTKPKTKQEMIAEATENIARAEREKQDEQDKLTAAWREKHEAYQAERDAERAKIEQVEREVRERADALKAEQAQAALDARKNTLRQAWIAKGGTAGEFDLEWPTIRRALLLEATVKEEDARRAAFARQVASYF